MSSLNRILMFFVLFYWGGFTVFAQPLYFSSKKDYLKIQLENARLPNNSAYTRNVDYVNGKLYDLIGTSYSNPYFEDNSWKSGDVMYIGRKYDVPLLIYDLSKDILIQLLYSNQLYTVSFKQEFVKEFTISGHHFRYLDDFQRSSESTLKRGYYELVYDGLEQFYVRWEKYRDFKNDPYNQNYIQLTYLYLKKDGLYFRIIGNKSLVAALKDHKKEVRSFIRKNNTKIRVKNFDHVRDLLKYYDELKRNE